MSFPTILRRSLPTWLVLGGAARDGSLPPAPLADARARCRSRAPRWQPASRRGEIVVVGGFTADGGNSAARRRVLGRPEHAGGGCPTCRSRSTTPLPRARTAASTSSAATAATASRSRPSSCSERTRRGGASRRCPTHAPRRRRRSRAASSTSLGGVDGRRGLARVAFALDLRHTALDADPGTGATRAPCGGSGRDARVRASAAAAPGSTRTRRDSRSTTPRTRRWTRLAPIPQARGGTGAAYVDGRIVSVGGEQPARDDRVRLRVRAAHEALARLCPTCRRPATASASLPAGGRV